MKCMTFRDSTWASTLSRSNRTDFTRAELRRQRALDCCRLAERPSIEHFAFCRVRSSNRPTFWRWEWSRCRAVGRR